MKHMQRMLAVLVVSLLGLSPAVEAGDDYERGHHRYRDEPEHYQSWRSSHHRGYREHRRHDRPYWYGGRHRYDYFPGRYRRGQAYGHHRRHQRHRHYPAYYGPVYGMAISIWLDGIGFSYYEPGYHHE